MRNFLDKILNYYLIIIILVFWQLLSSSKIIPKFLLPSPFDILNALKVDFNLISNHMKYTMFEAIAGLVIGLIIAFILSIIMDRFDFIFKTTMPVLVISQTIPTVAIAPLLVLWLGYGMSSKIVLITLTTFFPITISLLDGYRSVSKDNIILLESMGASKFQEYIYAKFPSALPSFFAGLRISVSYSIISAVVAEWIGAFNGLGVYMMRSKRAFAYDKMFASIFLISLISLVLIYLVSKIEKYIIKWEEK
ncbi:ABC transporter permease [Pseudostreptobacillus hongkongensis]|uniref:ABC transporter permease n=1 Tax=Pseudostreptobacillus hongkongensis TaxID=1162717 RepID=UPI0028D2F400|nr:ABC transporter permease [Pseudostreptobacillus hongkongensis]